MAAPAEGPNWSPLHRLIFRFIFLYTVFYNFPGPVLILQPLFRWYKALWGCLAGWASIHVARMGTALHFHSTGSGDTKFDYALLFCMAAAALIGALLWTVLDRRSRDYRLLHGGWRIFLRYTLAFALLTYGFEKVFPAQFTMPDPGTLMEPYGRSSPMHLLWTFMGASPAYTIFGGLGELAAGLMLLFRRTTLLGSLLAIAVMSNVVMMNFAYDVPVKLYSANLLLIALVLAAPDLQRLTGFFILQRPTVPSTPPKPIANKSLRRGTLIFKTAYLMALVGWPASIGHMNWKRYGNGSKPVPLQGLYTDELFVADGAEHLPLTTDASRWYKVAIFESRGMIIQFMDESRTRYLVKVDEAGHHLSLTPSPLIPAHAETETKAFVVTYTLPDPSHLVLSGNFGGHELFVHLRKEDTSSYLLLSRGFHWVNEDPYNR